MLGGMRRHGLTGGVLLALCALQLGCALLPRGYHRYQLDAPKARHGIARLMEMHPAVFERPLTLVTFLDRRP